MSAKNKLSNDVETSGNAETNPVQKQPTASTLFDQFAKIVDHAHKEIEGVRSVYKWLLSILGIMLTLIFIVGLYFTYNSVSDFRDEIKTHGEKLQLDLVRESNALGDRLQADLNSNLNTQLDQIRSQLDEKVTELSRQVEARIDSEFRDENITLLIRSNAEERIDIIADFIIEEKIRKYISPKIKEASYKLLELEAQQKEAEEGFQNLESKSEFLLTAIYAQNDDRESFEKLSEWANNPSFPLQELANNTVIRIRASYVGITTPGYVNVAWKEGVEPEKLPLSRLIKEYESIQSYFHTSLLKFIWERNDIPLKDRLHFLVDVLQKEKSLTATYYAGKFFAKEASIKWNPFVIEPLLDWWQKNKEKIEE